MFNTIKIENIENIKYFLQTKIFIINLFQIIKINEKHGL